MDIQTIDKHYIALELFLSTISSQIYKYHYLENILNDSFEYKYKFRHYSEQQSNNT